MCKWMGGIGNGVQLLLVCLCTSVTVCVSGRGGHTRSPVISNMMEKPLLHRFVEAWRWIRAGILFSAAMHIHPVGRPCGMLVAAYGARGMGDVQSRLK